MKRSKKEIIIEALQSGKSFNLVELTAYLSKTYGEDVDCRNVSPILPALVNRKKSEIGYFIRKRKKPGHGNAYKMVAEACKLPIEELIDLSRKNGINRFTLLDAVKKYPELQKYVDKFSSSDHAEEAPVEEMAQSEVPSDKDHEIALFVEEFLEKGIKINLNLTIKIL